MMPGDALRFCTLSAFTLAHQQQRGYTVQTCGGFMAGETEMQKEKHKAFAEYLRFLTTLSTGSIVLLTTFLGRVDTQPKLGFLIGVALASFMISVFSCVVAYTLTIMNFGEYVGGWSIKLVVGAMTITWVSFLVAISALTIFGVLNL
jgi:hypothetical protein